MTEAVEPDAWKQHADLVERFTRTWEPRPDLRVVALAWSRGVSIKVVENLHDRHPRWYSPTGQRNVRTMRELAEAILAACDFVEQMNPHWAES